MITTRGERSAERASTASSTAGRWGARTLGARLLARSGQQADDGVAAQIRLRQHHLHDRGVAGGASVHDLKDPPGVALGPGLLVVVGMPGEEFADFLLPP